MGRCIVECGIAEMSGTYHIPPELAIFRVVPKQDEKDDENFPRNLGEAVMLFLRTQNKACADEVVQCIQTLLEILAKGPDGQSKVNIASKACVCWDCVKVALPDNTSEVENATASNSESYDVLPACIRCKTNDRTNLVIGAQPDGTMLPFIEKVDPTPSDES